MTSPFLAIAKDKGPLRTALETILKGALVKTTPDDVGVIGLVIPKEAGGGDWADQSASILNSYAHCVGIVLVQPEGKVPLKHHRPYLRDAFESGFVVPIPRNSNKSLLRSLLRGISCFMRDPAPPEVMHSVREMVFASSLYRKIEVFGHGGTKDLTNQVLAPLRILLHQSRVGVNLTSQWRETASALLRTFDSAVIAKCRDDWWLSAALKNAFKGLGQALPLFKSHDRTEVARLERIMDLLTECRILAGARPHSSRNDPGIQPALKGKPSGQSWSYEVLVIDDHAEAWRPVFAELQSEMAQGVTEDRLPVTFEFLTGGEDYLNTPDAIGRLLARLPDYDAVLLDVYVNPTLDGIQLLKEVRRHYVNLPIIIWTSSRALELPAEAQLAHGYLFKKTATIKVMAGLLAERLREGNAKRRYPLPGHFFDHSIRSRKNRKTALRFAEYGSKQLDSFHALDQQYFRFFTDHGGRHVIKLLEYLEGLLRPFIGNSAVFSGKEAEREEEILALYLAVFLHEFGMLKLKGKNEPSENELPAEEQKRQSTLTRALHALRGMVMVADPECRYWPDEEGQYQARKRFFAGSNRHLVSSVAVITGYHSRLLPIGEANRSFCKCTKETRNKIGEKTAKALRCWNCKNPKKSREVGLRLISSRFFSMGRVEKTLMDCRNAIPAKRLARLRRHCALFRFADAIDVDYTRNPADFLSLDKDVSGLDLRESLKRQVIRGVRTEGGSIVFLACVPSPPKQLLDRIVEAPGWPDPDRVWDGEWTVRRIEKLRICQRRLDDTLAEFWREPLKQAALLGLPVRKDGKLEYQSKLAIASLTALSVAWEVADEYEAVIKCDLGGTIQLREFRWRQSCRCSKRKNMLSMLFHQNGLDRLCK
jgi:hypothetical protein